MDERERQAEQGTNRFGPRCNIKHVGCCRLATISDTEQGHFQRREGGKGVFTEAQVKLLFVSRIFCLATCTD